MTKYELAEAMIRGKNAPRIKECQTAYILVTPDFCLVCGLGAGLVGHFDGDYLEARAAFTECHRKYRGQDETVVMAHLLGIPHSLAEEIEHRHLSDESIEEIAAWLKSDS